MYENIDEGIDDLENTIYKKQLKTSRGWNIIPIEKKVSELTNIAWIEECIIDKELTSKDIEAIWNWRFDQLFWSIKDECKIDDALSIEFFLDKYVNVVREFDLESRRIAQEQSDSISEIARVWIYSDGNDQNSPFDLIVDLQNINNIIFSKEIPYEGVNSENNNDIFECLYEKFAGEAEDLIVENIQNSIVTRDQIYEECENFSSTKNYWENFELEWLSDWIEWGQDWGEALDFWGTRPDGNTLVCQDSSVQSGLSPEQISLLVETTWAWRDVVPITTFLPDDEVNPDDPEDNSPIEYPESNYSKVTDDDIWPCTEHFCIKVKFQTKNYDLLTWGKTKSIESIIENSNKHLKFAANTILVQSKMTINNGELWWRDLNLPDMFHSGVQVQFTPPPILNLSTINSDSEEWATELWDDFTLENMLESYLSHAGMSFERQNDIQAYLNVSRDRKAGLGAQELTTDELLNEIEEVRITNWQLTKSLWRKILDKKVNNEDIKDLERQFAEIEVFSKSMEDYVLAASSIIQKLREIPISQ